MKEDFLHFVWEYSLFDSTSLCTTDKLPIQIINKGLKNQDSGPDFFNAKIKIGDTIWAGNVEIHINSSDWKKHNHQLDKAYDNVILHVVYYDDEPLLNKQNKLVPTLELNDKIKDSLYNNYQHLLDSKNWIPCSDQIKIIEDFTINVWMERLAFERLERKSKEIEETLKVSNNNWEQVFYQYLLRYFGLKVNALPFYQLAVNTPSKIFEKHNSLLSIEALLFGQAGFLDQDGADKYYNSLQQEYKFIKTKFSLNKMDKSLWKFMRLRPANFPTIRISQIANLFLKQPRLFSKVIEAKNVKELQTLFKVSASEYWNNHYQFEKIVEEDKIKNVGKSTVDNLIINVVVPFTFLFGKFKNNQALVDKSIRFLEELKPEKNSIINNWQKLGVKAGNSLQSQSLIELKNSYCSEKKCLNCNIGSKILRG